MADLKAKLIAMLQRIRSPLVAQPKRAVLVVGAISLVTLVVIALVKPQEIKTVVVQSGDITETISVAGTVEPNIKLELQFEQPGTVATIPLEVGDTVQEGDLLISLAVADQQARVAEAQSGLNIAQAELNLLLADPEAEDVVISEGEVKAAEIKLRQLRSEREALVLQQREATQQAEQTVANAQAELTRAQAVAENTSASNQNTQTQAETNNLQAREDTLPALQTTLVTLQEALREVDQLFGLNDNILDSTIDEILEDASLSKQVSARNQFRQLDDELADFATQVSNASTVENYEEALAEGLRLLASAKVLANETYEILEADSRNTTSRRTVVDALIADISSVQANLSTTETTVLAAEQALETTQLANTSSVLSSASDNETAVANLLKAETSLSSAKSAQTELQINQQTALDQKDADIAVQEVQVAQSEARLDQLINPPRPVDIAAARARVNQASAALQAAQADLGKRELRAPTAGIVTDIGVELGETVATQTVAVTINSRQQQIKTTIAETDIAKVQSGNAVTTTFDALPDQEFSGTITFVDPAETIVQGLAFYEAIVVLDDLDAPIKSGMSADLEIKTATAEGALFIPVKAIQYQNNQPYVEVYQEDRQQIRYLELGITDGTHYTVNIGLEPGLEIIIP